MAELESDVDYSDIATTLVPSLVELREAVLSGLDAVAGFRRLSLLFDPQGEQELTADMLPGQLVALAITAMRRWITRRGRPAVEEQVDLRRVAAAAGREPDQTGDEYVLGFDHGRLVFELDDLAVGHAMLRDANHELRSTPFALSARALEHLAWALAARDTGEASGWEALDELVDGVLTDPWLDITTVMPRVLAELEGMADAAGGAEADVLREIVRRAPSSN